MEAANLRMQDSAQLVGLEPHQKVTRRGVGKSPCQAEQAAGRCLHRRRQLLELRDGPGATDESQDHPAQHCRHAPISR